MIEVNTKSHGVVNVSDDDIITFPEGILGFDYVKRYVIIDDEEGSPLKFLQAMDEVDLVFVIINPLTFMQDYKLSVSYNDLSLVDSTSAEDLEIYAIVTIPPSDPYAMTANLMGPVLINRNSKLGCQAISMSDLYNTRHSIIKEMENMAI